MRLVKKKLKFNLKILVKSSFAFVITFIVIIKSVNTHLKAVKIETKKL